MINILIIEKRTRIKAIFGLPKSEYRYFYTLFTEAKGEFLVFLKKFFKKSFTFCLFFDIK